MASENTSPGGHDGANISVTIVENCPEINCREFVSALESEASKRYMMLLLSLDPEFVSIDTFPVKFHLI